jgi:hypothetical protein
MKMFSTPALLWLGLGLLLGGCASFDAQTEHGRSLTGLQRYFVVTNLSDNHAIDRQIVAALQARGLDAESGPLTMMPDKTQVIVTYDDRWAWDFGDHLALLRIAVHDTHTNPPFATVTFSSTVPGRQTTGEIIIQLVGRLFTKASPARP